MRANTEHPTMQRLRDVMERSQKVEHCVLAIKLRGALVRLRSKALQRAVDEVLGRAPQQSRSADGGKTN